MLDGDTRGGVAGFNESVGSVKVVKKSGWLEDDNSSDKSGALVALDILPFSRLMISYVLFVSIVVVVVAAVDVVAIFNVTGGCVFVVVVISVPVISEGALATDIVDIVFVVDEDDAVVIMFLLSLGADALIRDGIVDTSSSSFVVGEVDLTIILVVASDCGINWAVVVETLSRGTCFVKEDEVISTVDVVLCDLSDVMDGMRDIVEWLRDVFLSSK